MKACDNGIVRSWAYAAGFPGVEEVTTGLQLHITPSERFGSLT